MSLIGALYNSVRGSFGMLLFVGTALAQADVATASIGTDSVETSSGGMSAVDSVDNCMLAQSCIDRYLWSLYERTRKIDTIKVPEQIKGTVKRRGKTRTVTKMITKLVDEDFTWKDPKAAERAGMLPMDYVIGGMDSSFRVTLYHALRALDDAETASKTSAPSSKSRPRFSRVVTPPSTSLPRLINLSGLPATLRAMFGKR